MAYFYERHQSRNFELGKAASIVRDIVVTGTSDETEAYAIVLLGSPVIYDGLVRSNIRGDYQGGGVWYIELTYSNIDPQQALGGDGSGGVGGPGGDGGNTPQPAGPSNDEQALTSSFNFRVTASTEHITQSLGTVLKKSAVGFTDQDNNELQAGGKDFTLDNQRAIGLSESGITGVDVYMPNFEWSREVYRPFVTPYYLATLRSLCARVNNAQFYRWPEGDVLYLGAEGRTENGRWTINHSFAVRDTEVSKNIGNGIVLDKIRGWDVVHVVYGTRKLINKLAVPIPTNAYVERVYRKGDFSLLEIGT